MKLLVIFLIKIYQKTVSPDHGYFPILRLFGQCRHYPTCSEFTCEAVKKFGVFKGLYISFKRVLTC